MPSGNENPPTKARATDPEPINGSEEQIESPASELGLSENPK